MEILEFGDVELAVDRHGSEDGPAILLIAGGGQSMDWWTPEFCERLTESGRQVIRYDHRDTGQSTVSPAGEPNYTSADLVTDPLNILDALDIDKVDVVGLSMGGAIAQTLAVRTPDRLRSLTLVATSPAGGDYEELPAPTPVLAAAFVDPLPEPDWSDINAVIDYRTEIERPYAGGLGFDERRVRAIASIEVRRSRDMAASIANHFVADGSTGADPADIRMPTLVMHGTDDPMFPFPHGEALADAIPNARLIPLEGMGHEVPPPSLWPEVIPPIEALVDSAAAR
jgi:pimeloyl-ACP methyl ester carboxylesterase